MLSPSLTVLASLELLHCSFPSKTRISSCVASSYGQCHSSLYIRTLDVSFGAPLRSEKQFGGRVALSALCQYFETPATALEQKGGSLLQEIIDKVGYQVSWCVWTRKVGGNQAAKFCFVALFSTHWSSHVVCQFWWRSYNTCRITIQPPAMLITWPLRELVLPSFTLPTEL